MRRIRVGVLLKRAVLGSLAWWALTGGASGWESVVVGVPTILAAALVSAAWMPPISWSLRGLVGYAAHFVRESLRGGIDVARRVFDPRRPLDPGLVRQRLALRSDVARVMVANTLGLVPGTLTVEVDRDGILVHTLDVTADVAADIATTQRRVAELLDAPVPTGVTDTADATDTTDAGESSR